MRLTTLWLLRGWLKRSEFLDHRRAAKPATTGQAIEVPLWGAYPPWGTVDMIPTPGAVSET